MARVDIVPTEVRYAHFGLYTTNAGGTEPIIVRRKVGVPTDYMHSNSRKLARQRHYFTLATQHWSHLTPTQKGYYRNQINFVDVVGSLSEEKLLKGRQLFISREIRELNVAQKQLAVPFEVCIILVDEAYNPLHGKMWLYWQPGEGEPWESIDGDELIKGNFLFRNVKPGQFVYHPYGESEGYYDPELPETFMTQDELRRYHYHILLDRYYRLAIKEPWTVDTTPPDFERIILEPWTPLAPPELELVIAEPWTGLPFPELEEVIVEPWTGGLLPPEFGEPLIVEPWTGGLLPPELEQVLSEPWTGGLLPPELEEVIAEPWTGALEQKFESYTTGDDSQFGIYGTWWAAQTFIPKFAHKIRQVKLKLYKTTDYPVGWVVVGIRATDAVGRPTGADLCLGQIDGNSIIKGSPGLWYTITFDIGYNLIQGKQYAIVVRAPNASPYVVLQWRRDSTAATYLDGDEYYSDNSGLSWTRVWNNDHMFEEWGTLL